MLLKKAAPKFAGSHHYRRTATDRVRNGTARIDLSPLRHSQRYHDEGGRSDTSSISTSASDKHYNPYRRPPIEILKMLHNSMQSKQGASTEVIKLFSDWDVGDGELVPGMGMVRTNRSADTAKKEFGDKSLSDKEMRQGLNFLLSTKLDDNDARQIISMIDKDGDGKIDIREFLEVAVGNEIEERLRLHDWRRRRFLIPESKRKIIESRKHLAKPPKFRTGRIHPDDTEHQKRLRRARLNPTHRATFNRPERVLELLRNRISVSKMVSTFRNIDVGGNDKGLSKEKLSEGTAFNSKLEPAELADGINRNINMELDADEVLSVIKVFDTDGDGTCSFGEFVQALRGNECQNYIDSRRKCVPSYNVARRELLKAREIAAKVGSRSWDESVQRSPRVSMIAKLAMRDLDPNLKVDEDVNLGWAGPAILTSRRGAVGWTGARKRLGPQLGPKTEHTRRQHRDLKWCGKHNENPDSLSSSKLDSIDILKHNSAYTPKKKVKLQKIESTKPRRGPVTMSPRSQLNFAFDNEATIAARMNEINEITAAHREKERRRKENPQSILYDGGPRVIRESPWNR